MTPLRSSLLGCVIGVAAACARVSPEPAAGAPPSPLAALAPTAAPAPADGEGVVVLELFTSQGCSSCPPADRLLTELVRRESATPVLALAFHVDYWNRLGWTDPFSSSSASERQYAYAEALGDRGPYTPQLVIDGRAHVVGSQRRAVERAVAAAPRVPTMPVEATVTGAELRVSAVVPAGARAELALWQDGLVTDVTEGENDGRTLTNDRVVRALVPLDARGDARVRIDPAWRPPLGAAVVARDESLRVVAAVRVRPAGW